MTNNDLFLFCLFCLLDSFWTTIFLKYVFFYRQSWVWNWCQNSPCFPHVFFCIIFKRNNGQHSLRFFHSFIGLFSFVFHPYDCFFFISISVFIQHRMQELILSFVRRVSLWFSTKCLFIFVFLNGYLKANSPILRLLRCPLLGKYV